MKTPLLLVALWTAIYSTSFAQSVLNSPSTAFYFTSSPSSYVGSGETTTITPDGGYSFVVGSFYNIFYAQIQLPDYSDYWELDVEAPDGDTLTPDIYTDAHRFEDSVHPGLSFYGNSRGDNGVTGQFQVLDLTIADGVVISAAVDFTQYDEGNPNWWNVGSLRYNSTVPLTVPEPSSFALVLLASASFVLKRFMRPNTF
jgi:hypothetical protein